jgi:transmembrane sensor
MEPFREKRRQDERLKVAEQAAAWVIAFEEELGAKERTEFAEWLQESPLHVEFFLRATAVNQMGALLTPQTRARIEAATRTTESTDDIVQLGNSGSVPQLTMPHRDRKYRVSWGAGIAAAAAALVVGVLLLYSFGPLSWQRYATTVGEQRSVTLADGSIVYLNSDSRISVRYQRGGRDVRLTAGEALFKVAHDKARPFRVYIDAAVVQAVGTQFDVYRKPTETRVAVIDGVVQVSPRRTTRQTYADSRRTDNDRLAAPARLVAGQGVQLNLDGQVSKPKPINVAQVIAWRQRRLIFEWERLEAIVAEFNRYNRMQIRVEDEAAGARRYTAVFDANEPQTLLQFLASEDDLELTRQGDEFIIRQKEILPPSPSPNVSADSR